MNIVSSGKWIARTIQLSPCFLFLQDVLKSYGEETVEENKTRLNTLINVIVKFNVVQIPIFDFIFMGISCFPAHRARIDQCLV